VDSTFASPVNQNPLALGADLVVHSATKYLGGHSDITAGAVMGPAALLDRISPWRKNLGQMLAPETSALLARSLRTLVLRVRHQNSSALQIALAMQKHPLIKKVYYPGLTEFEGTLHRSPADEWIRRHDDPGTPGGWAARRSIRRPLAVIQDCPESRRR
jgi:cystathionine gamma-synthase